MRDATVLKVLLWPFSHGQENPKHYGPLMGAACGCRRRAKEPEPYAGRCIPFRRSAATRYNPLWAHGFGNSPDAGERLVIAGYPPVGQASEEDTEDHPLIWTAGRRG